MCVGYVCDVRRGNFLSNDILYWEILRNSLQVTECLSIYLWFMLFSFFGLYSLPCWPFCRDLPSCFSYVIKKSLEITTLDIFDTRSWKDIVMKQNFAKLSYFYWDPNNLTTDRTEEIDMLFIFPSLWQTPAKINYQEKEFMLFYTLGELWVQGWVSTSIQTSGEVIIIVQAFEGPKTFTLSTIKSKRMRDKQVSQCLSRMDALSIIQRTPKSPYL